MIDVGASSPEEAISSPLFSHNERSLPFPASSQMVALSLSLRPPAGPPGGVVHLLFLLLLPLPRSEALAHTRPPASALVAEPAPARCRQHASSQPRLAHPAGGAGSSGDVSSRLWAAPKGWASARAHVRCSLLGGLKVDNNDGPELHIGDVVRVQRSIKFMHVPGHKEGFDAQGAIGKVRRVYDQPNLSANREVKVEFDDPKKWIGHFEASELVLTEAAPRTMIHGG